jgi:hypothetical protein
MDELRKKILASARHLTAWQMARAMHVHGRDYRGCTKGHMVKDLLERPNSIDSQCLAFRMYANNKGEWGVVASDVEALEHKLAVVRRELEAHLEYKAKREAATKQSIYGLVNVTWRHESAIKNLEWMIEKAKSRP